MSFVDGTDLNPDGLVPNSALLHKHKLEQHVSISLACLDGNLNVLRDNE